MNEPWAEVGRFNVMETTGSGEALFRILVHIERLYNGIESILDTANRYC